MVGLAGPGDEEMVPLRKMGLTILVEVPIGTGKSSFGGCHPGLATTRYLSPPEIKTDLHKVSSQ